MRRRDFVVAAPALILVGCKNMDAGGALSAAGDLAKAASLTDAEVSGYAAQMVAAQDKQAKILGASSKYGQRMAKLTSGLQSFDGLKLDFKVYDSNQINAFACPNGAIRFYSGLMDAMTDDEIRYVIGHEIGHIKLGHSKSRMQLSLIHISEPTRRTPISYAVFCAAPVASAVCMRALVWPSLMWPISWPMT